MDLKKVFKILAHNPSFYDTLPQELKEDINFQIEAVTINPAIFRYMDDPCDQVKMAAVDNHLCMSVDSPYHPLKTMKNPTHEMLVAAVQNSPIAIRYIENQEPYIEESIALWPCSIRYVREQTAEIAWLALNRAPWALQYIKNPSYDMCFYATKENFYNIIHVPEEHKTEELCWIVINNNNTAPSLLNHVTHPTDDMIIAALSKVGTALAYVKEPTPDLCELAVRTTVNAIEFVPKNLLTEEMCWRAIQGNVNLLVHTFKTREMCEYVLQRNGYLIKKIENPDEDLCIQAVKTSPFALEYIENQTDDVIKMALSVTGMAIKHVRKQTPEMCLLAVQQDGTALAYVRNKTREICLQAFETDGFALTHLKRGELTLELCQAAVKQNPWAIESVPTEYIELLDIPKEIAEILFGEEKDINVLKVHPLCAATDVVPDDILWNDSVDAEALLFKEPRLFHYLDEMDVIEFVGDNFFEKHPHAIYYLGDQFVEEKTYLSITD